jgi:hypothetical protein
MWHALSLLAQIDPTKLDSSLPAYQQEASATFTWVIVGIITVGTLLVTFKTSKRNYLEKD